MKVNENGIYRDMTEEEETEYRKAVLDQTPRAKSKINKGEIFTVDGAYYVSTTTIPAGDCVLPGRNCNETSLAEALNALNA